MAVECAASSSLLHHTFAHSTQITRSEPETGLGCYLGPAPDRFPPAVHHMRVVEMAAPWKARQMHRAHPNSTVAQDPYFHGRPTLELVAANGQLRHAPIDVLVRVRERALELVI